MRWKNVLDFFLAFSFLIIYAPPAAAAAPTTSAGPATTAAAPTATAAAPVASLFSLAKLDALPNALSTDLEASSPKMSMHWVLRLPTVTTLPVCFDMISVRVESGSCLDSTEMRGSLAPEASGAVIPSTFSPLITTAVWSSIEPLWQQSNTQVSLTPFLHRMTIPRRSSSMMKFMSHGTRASSMPSSSSAESVEIWVPCPEKCTKRTSPGFALSTSFLSSSLMFLPVGCLYLLSVSISIVMSSLLKPKMLIRISRSLLASLTQPLSCAGVPA
mmetsp:Transcript_53175/g.168839  ORF Transcript_53175/g.168839 Transcript_53175/m.168839 type:complete len:272 (+) Transcript_53175:134-949(+)